MAIEFSHLIRMAVSVGFLQAHLRDASRLLSIKGAVPLASWDCPVKLLMV